MESVGPDHGGWVMGSMKTRLPQDTELPFQVISAAFFFFFFLISLNFSFLDLQK